MSMIRIMIIMMSKAKEGVPKSPMALSMKLPWKSKNFKAKSKVNLMMMMMEVRKLLSQLYIILEV